MALIDLIVDGIIIPVHSRFELNQSYTPLGGTAFLRFMDGGLQKQTQWERIATSITGGGNLPVPLDIIDYTDTFDIHCITPLALRTTDLVVTTPRSIRPDVPATVLGIQGNELVPADSVTVGNQVTITSIAGITDYVVQYFPILTVNSDRPEFSMDGNQANHVWTLQAEEI